MCMYKFLVKRNYYKTHTHTTICVRGGEEITRVDLDNRRLGVERLGEIWCEIELGRRGRREERSGELAEREGMRLK